MIFDVDYTRPFLGPAVASTARVNIVVADHVGDINVYDDRGGAGTIRHEDRLQSGNIQVANGRFLSWTLSQNVATQQATLTVASGKTDGSTYEIDQSYPNLSPSDPGFNPNTNPIVGLQVSDSQGNEGGISFDPGMNVTILTQGEATIHNSSPFKMTRV